MDLHPPNEKIGFCCVSRPSHLWALSSLSPLRHTCSVHTAVCSSSFPRLAVSSSSRWGTVCALCYHWALGLLSLCSQSFWACRRVTGTCISVESWPQRVDACRPGCKAAPAMAVKWHLHHSACWAPSFPPWSCWWDVVASQQGLNLYILMTHTEHLSTYECSLPLFF